MKIYVPKYYLEFKCKNKECKHSCCEKWEIDIDSNTYDYYTKIPGEFGDRIRSNIASENGCNSFKLNNGKCPFLDMDGLCDIISTLGEESLCQICTDHPRFRNYFSNKIEMGLGLSCEEAARIILSQDKYKYVYYDKNPDKKTNQTLDEKLIRIYRKGLIKNIKKSKTILEILNKLNIEKIKYEDIYLILIRLEVLDNEWLNRIEVLNNLNEIDLTKFNQFDVNVIKRLVIYFINRYLPKMERVLDTRYILFIKFSVLTILSIVEKENDTFNNIVDIAREYSEEVEYSEENVKKVISLLN